MGLPTVGELKPTFTGKRGFRLNSSIRHASEWPISEVSSDLTVQVGSSSFCLHKFPLVSRSGKIRKLLTDSKTSSICLSSVPGGSEAFELAAKFCYGINIDINLLNVAKLRCASHYLEMTEDFSEDNLAIKTENFFKETVLPSISNSILVLHHCEALVPVSEDLNLVNRLVIAIANNACKEQLTSGLLKLDYTFSGTNMEPETPLDWWGKSVAVLNLDFFQRVVSAVRSKGLRQDVISKILISYTNKSLQGLIVRDTKLEKERVVDFESKKKQRLIVETIVRLLPTQGRKSSVPMAFLSSLLKMEMTTSSSSASSGSCRSDLERRIGLQLDQAILEDVLIPTNPNGANNTMYDIDSILRIFSIFLNLEEDDDEEEDRHHRNRFGDETEMIFDFDSPGSPKQSSILKVHPNIKDSERYRLCKTIDSQKLSQEACSHAAQNERLPVQMAVQVLYFEQIRLRNAMSSSISPTQFLFSGNYHQFPQRAGSGAGSGAISPRDNYASVRRENRELKLEVARMRMRLTDLEKDHISIRQELVKTNPGAKLFKSFAKKISKLNSLFSFSSLKPSLKGKASTDSRFLFQRKRRHSVS
ncbi:BTB/POZ domain-containing protein [Raphanus sativus]|nr:BTB/POZ domain-containing protein [Raphanus sativus]